MEWICGSKSFILNGEEQWVDGVEMEGWELEGNKKDRDRAIWTKGAARRDVMKKLRTSIKVDSSDESVRLQGSLKFRVKESPYFFDFQRNFNMSQAHSNFSVNNLYQTVIEDVITGVREAFLDEGVDEQVLQELKLLWEGKLATSKALEKPANNQAAAAPVTQTPTNAQNSTTANNQSQPARGLGGGAAAEARANTAPMSNLLLAANREEMVSIQIKLPSVTGNSDLQRCVTIQVPASAIHANKLQDILTPAVIDATLSLPAEVAAISLQEKVLAALGYSNGGAHPQGSVIQMSKQTSVITTQSQNQKFKPLNSAVHLDGATGDSSDDEEEEEDDEDDLDDDVDDKDDEIEEEQEGEGQDEEPLNSEDDVSDNEDSNDKLYEIDNVVVCQYDKITRSRNKWKFHLKDGIMNLNGTDYVFQKANGDAEW